MDKDELTREEIEALLGGTMPPGGPGNSPSRPERPAAESVDGALASSCQRVAERFGAALSEVLRTSASVRFAGVRSATYGRFLMARHRASCGRALRCESPEGQLLLNVAGPILQAMIARLLGGDPQEPAAPRRMLTEIERRLASRVLAVLATELAATWPGVALRMDEAGDLPDPAGGLALPSSHPVAVARFDVVLGQLHGPIDLCLSIDLARQLAECLASAATAASAGDMSSLASHADAAASPETADQIARALEHSLVELRVELARTTATAGDLLHLAVGDIITTDQPADAPLVIELDGRPRFEARPGIHEGRRAIQIERPVDP